MLDLWERGFGETDNQTVCLDCIVDEGLREQLGSQLTEYSCTFCGREAEGKVAIAASLEKLMSLVMNAIHLFYERSEESLFWMDDLTPRSSSGDVVEYVCSGTVTEEVMEAIQETITEDNWNEDPGALRPDAAFNYAWNAFREKVKHQARFVFLSILEESSLHPDEITAGEILKKLFEIIESNGGLSEIPVGHIFYRGRMVDEPDARGYGASTLGSPPFMKASANRMSPAGISMFYGCESIPTVIAEIASHSTKGYAVVGAFETTKSLRMINLVELPKIPSIFDPEAREKGYFELLFLHDFARDLSSSVVLDGREHIEYVPTQVVTEYMRWLPSATIDGILFKSAQNGGTSCVIFCGPEGCADAGNEDEKTILRLQIGSIKAVRAES